MTFDRWRGRPGILGWLIWQWDVWQLRRAARILVAEVRRRRSRTVPGRDETTKNPA